MPPGLYDRRTYSLATREKLEDLFLEIPYIASAHISYLCLSERG